MSPFLEVVSILSFSWAFRGCYPPHRPATACLPPPLGFTVREMRGKLAIGITVNFVNRRTVEETQVPEISGVARIYNQSFFQSLLKATGQGPSLSWGVPPPACLWAGSRFSCPPGLVLSPKESWQQRTGAPGRFSRHSPTWLSGMTGLGNLSQNAWDFALRCLIYALIYKRYKFKVKLALPEDALCLCWCCAAKPLGACTP